MAAKSGIRMKSPVHPGGFLKTEILALLGLSVTDAARALRVTRAALSGLLNERVSLSAEMAIRFEKAFDVKMDTLMRMQASHAIAQARECAGSIQVARFEAGSAD